MTAIQVRGLTKHRRGRGRVVDDVSFDVARGRVCALLGPNGSGKTTILRMMVGLTRGSGSTYFDGRRFLDLPTPRKYVGAALAPAPFHPGRRVSSHLRMVAAASALPPERVDAVLDETGLTEYARAPIKALSLGLKQRLSIANAIIGDPAILLLDEPTNGLDPASAVWFRDYLRFVASNGTTVLVSSHHLREADAYAHDVVILDAGRVRAAGPVAALRAAHSADRPVNVRTEARQRLTDLVVRHGGHVVAGADASLQVHGLSAAAIGGLAAAYRVPLDELTPEVVTLEDIVHAVSQRLS